MTRIIWEKIRTKVKEQNYDLGFLAARMEYNHEGIVAREWGRNLITMRGRVEANVNVENGRTSLALVAPDFLVGFLAYSAVGGATKIEIREHRGRRLRGREGTRLNLSLIHI